MKRNFLNILVLVSLLFGVIGIINVSGSQVFAQAAKKDADLVAQINNKAGAFAGNATAFKNMIEGLDEKTIMKSQDKLISLIESILDNNKELQEITKKAASDISDPDKKKFYMRDILPNLHNINRQLMRIKVSIEKNDINYSNVKDQAERTEECIKQVVDRLKG
ncbi:MAG: hypothetical protein AB1782_12820 [Cyanobacteriota bacterium]